MDADQVQKATGIPFAAIESAARRLREAERKAIVFGRAIVEHPAAAALLQAIESLGWTTGALEAARSSVMYAGPNNDSQGALDMGLTPDRLPGYAPAGDASARQVFEPSWGATLPTSRGLSAPEILDAAAEGRIKAVWIASDHWLRSAPDRARVEAALGKLELVIVSDLFLTETAERAHVVFPAVSFAEKEGVVVNCEAPAPEEACARSIRAAGPARTWEIFQVGGAGDGRQVVLPQLRGRLPRDRATGADLPRNQLGRVAGRGPAVAERAPWLPRPPLRSRRRPTGEANGDAMWLLSGGTLFLQGSLSHHGGALAQAGQRGAGAHSSR
jgi:anaerobic selenocysteine-containing dehydrogenase